MFSSSLLQSALFCASATMSGGSCLMAVVANLRIHVHVSGQVESIYIQVTDKTQAKTSTYTITLTWI